MSRYLLSLPSLPDFILSADELASLLPPCSAFESAYESLSNGSLYGAFDGGVLVGLFDSRDSGERQRWRFSAVERVTAMRWLDGPLPIGPARTGTPVFDAWLMEGAEGYATDDEVNNAPERTALPWPTSFGDDPADIALPATAFGSAPTPADVGFISAAQGGFASMHAVPDEAWRMLANVAALDCAAYRERSTCPYGWASTDL